MELTEFEIRAVRVLIQAHFFALIIGLMGIAVVFILWLKERNK